MREFGPVVLTHGGKFHADDVFSTALLKMVDPTIQVKRVFQVPEGFTGLCYDIGGGEFDHHQRDAEVRENGVPYAAFGLLWREFGVELLLSGCTQEQAEREAAFLDEKWIQPMDLHDNTGCGNDIADLIDGFNPGWDSDRHPDDCFEEAVAFASVILQHKLEGIFRIQRARAMVTQALERAQGGIVILERFAPWKMVLVDSDAEFVVYPSQRGGFNAQAVPDSQDTSVLKCPFPQEWAGLEPEALRELSGIPNLRFCHNNRFLIGADTLEDAIAACKAAQAKRGV